MSRFEKVASWASHHKFSATLAVGILPLLVTHILFSVPAPIPWLVPHWDEGDVLTYCAGFMAFCSAVYLGKTAKDQNDKLMDLQSKETLRAESCNVNLKARPKNTSSEDILYTLDGNLEANSYVRITACDILVHNTSSAFLQSVKIYTGTFNRTINLTLSEGEKKVVHFVVLDRTALYQVAFTSCYGVTTYGDFLMSFGANKGDPDINDTDTSPHLKYYHYYGTTPPKQDGATDAKI